MGTFLPVSHQSPPKLMNQPPLISIIIPVFNTIDYLDHCISCLTQQTINTIQLIFVDNGSSDGSYERLLELAKQDPRVDVLSVEGGQQGRCRNLGIQKAKGEYIGFCDSDDWCALDMFEQLLNNACECDADIAIGQVIRSTSQRDRGSYHFQDRYFKKGIYTHAEIPFLTRMTTCYNKIYKKSLLIDNSIQFLEVAPHEDVGFAFKALHAANTIVSVPEATYFWRINPDSITQVVQGQAKPNDAVFDMIRELKMLCNDLNVEYEWQQAANRLIDNHLLLMIKNISTSHVASYLNAAYDAAGYIPNKLFDKLKVTPSQSFLGDKLYEYYQAQRRFIPASISSLGKYRALSKRLGIIVIVLTIMNIYLIARWLF